VAENPPLVAGDVRKKKVVRFALSLKEGYEYAAKEGESFEDISSKYGGAKSRTRSGGRNGAVITPIIDDYEEEEPTSVVGLDRKSTKIDLAGRPFPIIPTSYSEAMTTPYANEWRAECQNEFKVSDFKMPSTLSLPLQEPLSSTRSGLSASRPTRSTTSSASRVVSAPRYSRGCPTLSNSVRGPLRLRHGQPSSSSSASSRSEGSSSRSPTWSRDTSPPRWAASSAWMSPARQGSRWVLPLLRRKRHAVGGLAPLRRCLSAPTRGHLQIP
jgi:hypothetical protein